MRERVSRALVPAVLALVIGVVLCAPIVSAAMIDVPKAARPAGESRASAVTTPTSQLTSTTATPGSAGWARADVTATIEATDNAGGGGNLDIYYLLMPQDTSASVNATSVVFPVTREGTTTVSYFAASSGTTETTNTAFIRIDKSAPAVSVNATASYDNTASIPISVVDTYSGVARIDYRFDNAATQTASSATTTAVSVLPLGVHTLRVWATDVAGNSSGETSRTFVIRDTQPPVSSLTATPAVDWSSVNVTVTISAIDVNGSGVARTSYWLKAPGATAPGAETTYTAPGFQVSADGTTTVYYRSRDVSGNVEATQTAEVRIDKSAPVGPALLSYSSLTDTSIKLVWPAATDALSGVSHYEVYVGASRVATTTALTSSLTTLTADTPYWFSVRAIDKAGNVGNATLLAVTTPGAGSTVPVGVGASVPVTLAVPAGGLSGSGEASVTITNVATAGTLKLVRLSQTQLPTTPIPGTLRFLGDFYDLSFTGSFTGTATVTLPYDARIPASRAAALRMVHWTGSAWETLVPVVDPANHTVTFALKSFSPLSLVEPASTNTTATITFSKTAIYAAYGSSPAVTARMVDASGTPLPGFTLMLLRYAGGWSDFATMTPVAGDPGAYRADATPYKGVRTTFQVRLVPDSVANPLYTAALPKMRVVPKAKFTRPKSSTTRARAYRTFYVSGRMLPKRATTVRMHIYRWNGKKYAYVGYKKVKTRATGYYRTSMKLKRGTYRFRARVGKNSYYSMLARTYSSYSVKVRVR